MVEAVFK